MRKLRRVIASLSVIAILSTLVVSTTAFAQTFTDVSADAYYYSAVEMLAADGIVDDSNGTFDPTGLLERQASAKLAVEAFGLSADLPTDPTFIDVPTTLWSYASVETAYANGVVKGYAHKPGYFGPVDTVTREQMAKIIVEAANLPTLMPDSNPFSDMDEGMWSYPFVQTAYCYGVLNGYSDGSFGPTDSIVRQDGAVMVAGALDAEPRSECSEGGLPVDDIILPEGGELSVSLSPDTPPTQVSVPGGATGVEVAAFDFEAGDTEVVITNLTLKRVGVGNTDDFAKVYLYHDGMKLGNGKTLNDSTNEALFNNVMVSVAPGQTETIMVKADIERGLLDAGVHAFQITDMEAVDATADAVVGNFPIKANDLGTSTVDNGAVDVESNGTDYTRKVGESDVEVANFTVHVSNDEDAMLNSITLYNDDDDVVTGLTLWRGSEPMANGVQNGRYFTFDLDEPIYITKGDSLSFKVRADIGGKDGDTAEFYIRYNTDVSVEGNTYGYNLFIDATSYGSDDSYVDEAASDAAGATQDNITTIEAGQITVAFNGPTANDVSVNSNDVVLMDFTLSAQSNVDIEKMTVNIAQGAGSGSALAVADFDDIEILCDGVIVASEGAVAIGDNVFSDTWSIAAGETLACQVRVDITNDADDGDSVVTTLVDLTGAGWTLRDSDTNDQITDIIPSGDVEGNEMTITDASLIIDVAAAPASGNLYVSGTPNVDAVGFIFQAGDSDDVLVNSVKLTAYGDNDVNDFADPGDIDETSGVEDMIGSVCIYEEETMTLLDTCDALDVNASDITVQFDTLNWMIPAGETRKLLVQVNVTTTAPLESPGPTVDNDYFAFAILADGDIDAEYGTGTALTADVNTGNNAAGVFQEISDKGTITLSLLESTPDAMLVEGGAEVLVTTVKLKADDEAFVVEKLEIENASGLGATSVRLAYTDSNGAPAVKSQDLTDGAVVGLFTGLDILVPEDGETTVDIYATTQDIDDGGVNNATFAIGVLGTTGTFRAVGVNSGEVEVDGGADVVGDDMTVFETYPVLAWTTDPDGGEPYSGEVASGLQTLGWLEITSVGDEQLLFSDINTIGEITIATSGTPVNTIDCTLRDNSTIYSEVLATVVGTDINFVMDEPLVVSANSTKILDVRCDTSDVSTDNESVSLYLDSSVAGNMEWSIGSDDTVEYLFADIIFRPDILAGIFS